MGSQVAMVGLTEALGPEMVEKGSHLLSVGPNGMGRSSSLRSQEPREGDQRLWIGGCRHLLARLARLGGPVQVSIGQIPVPRRRIGRPPLGP
jgi:hypothetical protein